MKNIIIIAGVAAFAAAAPVAAKPDKGHGNHHATMSHGKHGQVGHRMANCPPGLAKKNNGCMAPGQAKKRYNVGQRLPYGYNNYTPYNQIPYDVRNQYNLDPTGRYIYDQNYVYGVDQRTNAITQILSAILR